MGTDKVVFAEDPDDLTIVHAQPEVMSPETALTGSHRSYRVRMHGSLLIFLHSNLRYFLYCFFTAVFASICCAVFI